MNENHTCETALMCIRAATISTFKYWFVMAIGLANFVLSIFLIGLDLITITRINRTFSLDLEDDDSCVYLHGTFLAGARRRLAFQLLWSFVNIIGVGLLAKCVGTEHEKNSFCWKTLARSWVLFHCLLTLTVGIHLVVQFIIIGFRLPELIRTVIIIFQLILLGFFLCKYKTIGDPPKPKAKKDAELGASGKQEESKRCCEVCEDNVGVCSCEDDMKAWKAKGSGGATDQQGSIPDHTNNSPGPTTPQLRKIVRHSLHLNQKHAILEVVPELTTEPEKNSTNNGVVK